MVAKMAETLDRLSGGRLILGLGAGYSDEEFRAFGLRVPTPRQKVDGLDEAIRSLRGLWTQPGVHIRGRPIPRRGADLEPKPERPDPDLARHVRPARAGGHGASGRRLDPLVRLRAARGRFRDAGPGTGSRDGPVSGASRDACRASANRGTFSDRRQRHSQREGARAPHRRRAGDRGQAVLRADREEVERMLHRVVRAAEADFDARLLIDASNEAETVMQATEKSLRRPDFERDRRASRRRGAPGDRRGARGVETGPWTATDREAIRERTHAVNDATQHLAEVMMNRSVKEALGRERHSEETRVTPLFPPFPNAKVTFIKDGKETTVEFEHGKLANQDHGLPESFLDVAMNLGIPLEHACGGSCACTTCHLIIRKGRKTSARWRTTRPTGSRRRGTCRRDSRLGCQAVIKGDVVSSSRCIRATTCRRAAPSSSGSPIAKEEKRQEVPP